MRKSLLYLMVGILLGAIFIAWTAVPDCWQPGVCG